MNTTIEAMKAIKKIKAGSIGASKPNSVEASEDPLKKLIDTEAKLSKKFLFCA